MEYEDNIEESTVELLVDNNSSGGESRWVDCSEVDSEPTPAFSVEETGSKDGYGSDVSIWHTLALAFQTLGVVYGDMGTSPLYVFTDVFSKVNIDTKYAKVNKLPNHQPADEQISSFRFADLGHFSVESILIAFTFVVFPCLLLAYMGQAAYLMKHPESATRIFYVSVPDSLFWPVFIIATLAAMIASQAMISATFSCVKQSMALGCFPRVKIIHTSKKLMGQIYIPVVNWVLMIMCIVVVSILQSTTDIAIAYG
ncbi:hypothetical protein JRO89_XS05G0077800 [Xanthoceras sorbifolium]|uniref:K+ potassium transporter integral membrane domain-containing protein n=1 Tax=Xanthoceras sorbifolium TaxID=99658 RepID=A0ABQ8I0U9_9ROSI|nr:hypothetical protein JRO89_XS05G0077800 [Xanthoceras sorbifolium]